MSSDEGTQRVRYHFGAPERRGLVAGWRGGQIATVGAGIALGVLALRADPSIGGALAALVVLGISLGAATWPLGGRTAEEWAPDALRYMTDPRRRRRASRRDCFASLRIVSLEMSGKAAGALPSRRAAVVMDVSTRTYTALFSARASGFVLLGEQEKAQRVDAWAGALASVAREGSQVHRVQWVARSGPSRRSLHVPGGQLPRDPMNGSTPEGAVAACRSYRALIEEHAGALREHETVVALSISAAKASRAVRAAGGSDRGACSLALKEAASFRRRLSEAGVVAGALMSEEEIGRFVREAFSPAGTHCAVASSSWPWPIGARSEWARAHIEGTWHASYWVSQWPRTEVGPDMLGPLLLLGEDRLTVSVVMEPLAPLQAVRKLEQARTADIADSELRRRGGFLATARHRREEEQLARREVELADGHAPYRYSGYVSVSAADPDSLAESCARTEQAAARCGLELRLCYGAQLDAFGATLPLCRGLA